MKTTYLFLFLSALGFLDSAFLTIQHYSRDPLTCPLFGGCEEVTSSIYSEVFGIPVALLGALYYGLIFLLSLYSYLTNNRKALHLAGYFTPVGLLCSVYLVYLMFFVLGAVCFYCLISAMSSTLLFVVFIVNWLAWKKTKSLVKESEKN
ncbi:hypothetical protein A2803_05785 [Candidatus Woesebacteria bacterium RIFCSPHIGHO2_01_FULL_44_21]|uniref:Vitamin K epoxide reductase domain-containing protein n=1 Tax=Candidatus Woesebacteria bacterium RIFCSPHIGHO2_01_FULL_44_21 TaxID=1802503 RepID=A0A1F7Z1I7_9BACT|nr:MAG: hypothetical protein A2803_05785 [Candidatus Woesebacteria bacterium RIFCSPHIGHO2_01_FULL_44_21]OGM71097.1 MAG: hypothetical protein A2897_02640 [Candidatus Woesebacteria bacterium RIFCSPLOWO2_01_FULL_44_24b]